MGAEGRRRLHQEVPMMLCWFPEATEDGREKTGWAGTAGPQREETGGMPRPRGDSRDDMKDRESVNKNEM